MFRRQCCGMQFLTLTFEHYYLRSKMRCWIKRWFMELWYLKFVSGALFIQEMGVKADSFSVYKWRAYLILNIRDAEWRRWTFCYVSSGALYIQKMRVKVNLVEIMTGWPFIHKSRRLQSWNGKFWVYNCTISFFKHTSRLASSSYKKWV